MNEKAVKFGSTVRGRVLVGYPGMIFVKGDDGQGYILSGNKEKTQPGDTGTLVFTHGGPKGGFWQFIPDGQAVEVSK